MLGLELLPFTVDDRQGVVLKAGAELIQPKLLLDYFVNNICPHLIQLGAGFIDPGKSVGVLPPCLAHCPWHLLCHQLTCLVDTACLTERVDPIHHHCRHRVLLGQRTVISCVLVTRLDGLAVDQGAGP